ncbi:MAG: hypothetical protein WCH39_13375 [Schlesneria sp.]
MREFFKGWRRKFGVVALVMALGFVAGWMRSQLLIDMISLPKPNGKVFVCSASERIVWISHDIYSDGRIEWAVLPIQLTNVSSYFDRTRSEPHWERWGLFYGRSDGQGSPFSVFAVSYWFFIFPLTLLSSFLLALKPK